MYKTMIKKKHAEYSGRHLLRGRQGIRGNSNKKLAHLGKPLNSHLNTAASLL